MSASWRGLTAAQRASWAAFAMSFTVVNSIGTTINLTGHQCYVKVNTVLLLKGSAAVSVPPALPSFAACTATGATATAGTPSVKVAGANPAAGTTHMFYASPQLSPGVSYNAQFRFLADSATYTTGNFDLTALYTAKFGAPIVGKQIQIRVVQEQAGMQDNGTTFSAIVGS